MLTLKASEFKARCLALMDDVARTGEPVLITKNGKPVAELVPVRGTRVALPFGLHKGQVATRGDIVAPLGDEWDAMR